MVERAHELGKNGPPSLLELALEIEYGAYDLYKNLAVRQSSVDVKVALTNLAQQEKQHAESVLRALGQIAQ